MARLPDTACDSSLSLGGMVGRSDRPNLVTQAQEAPTQGQRSLSRYPETHEIEAELLTENSGHDADQVEELIEQVNAPIDTFYGDGAYDQWKVYDCLAEEEIQPIIPPRRKAALSFELGKQHSNSSQSPLARDEAVRGIRDIGRKQRKKEIGYHRRRLSRNRHAYRLKCCFGDKLKNRELENQRAEARLISKALNHFTHLGLPQFE